MKHTFNMLGLAFFMAMLSLSSAAYGQQKGDKVEVLWNNSWYPATVIEEANATWKIHYEGYGNEWDEWVKKDRIRMIYKKGDKVQVFTNNTWADAEVIEIKGEQYKVRYNGKGAEYDEWVGKDRLGK